MRRRSDEKHAAILEKAAEAFASQGFHEVAMDQLAQAAGVSKGTIYTYFADKSDLYRAAVQFALDQVWERIQQQLEGARTPTQRLRAILLGTLEFFREHPHYLQLVHVEERRLLTGDTNSPLHTHRQRVTDLVSQVMRDACDAGEFSIARPDWAARALLGMTRAIFLYGRPSDSTADMADQVLHLFINGVKAAR